MTSNTNPNFRTGQIPTAVQWNADFGEKVDASAGTSNNQVINTPTINGAVGGSPSFAQLNATVLANSASTARTLSAWFSDITNVKAFGATGDGVTDDTAAIQAAITALGNGGCLLFPAGTYKFSSTLTRQWGQTWRGVAQYNSKLLWAGANDTSLIDNTYTATGEGHIDRGGLRQLTIDAGTATGVTCLHVKNQVIGVYEDLYIDCKDGLNNTGLYVEGGADSVNINSGANIFRYIYVNHATTGVLIGGTGGTGAATVNSFHDLTIGLTSTAVGTGIVFTEWCDSNCFHYTRIILEHTNSTGIIFNRDDPTGTPTVYNENFFGLIIDNIGDVTGSTVFDINSSSGLIMHGVFLNTSPWPGTVVDASADARSYDVLLNNPSVLSGIGNMERISSNITNNELWGPFRSLSGSFYYHTPTSGALVGTAIGAAGRIYATPIFIGAKSTIKNLNFNVTSASGSNWNGRMGIYADNGFFSPGSLVANTDTGDVAVAAAFTGSKSVTLNGGSGVTLARGIYWTVFTCDATGAAVSSTNGASGGNAFGCSFIGTTFLNSAFTTAIGSAKYVDIAYGALPASFGTPTVTGTSPVPVVVYGA